MVGRYHRSPCDACSRRSIPPSSCRPRHADEGRHPRRL